MRFDEEDARESIELRDMRDASASSEVVVAVPDSSTASPVREMEISRANPSVTAVTTL